MAVAGGSRSSGAAGKIYGEAYNHEFFRLLPTEAGVFHGHAEMDLKSGDLCRVDCANAGGSS